MNSRKNNLIFALDGMLLDKNYGARYVDAIGLRNAFNEKGIFGKNIVTDYPNNYDINEFSTICIIPKNVGLFENVKGFKEKQKNQHEFINRIKKLPLSKRPEIVLFFNDINIGLHGNYADKNDFFEGLKFKCIYAFKSDKDHQAKDIFIDKKYHKHIDQELETEWIVLSHLDSILDQQDDENSLFKKDIKIGNIDSFYYGDYRPGIVDSLNKIKKGKGCIIGNRQLAEETNMIYLSEKLPMYVIKEYIKKAKYNLVPYEELKTNRQITARLIELIVFGREDLSHIVSDNWKFLERENIRTKQQAINDLQKIANQSINEILGFI